MHCTWLSRTNPRAARRSHDRLFPPVAGKEEHWPHCLVLPDSSGFQGVRFLLFLFLFSSLSEGILPAIEIIKLIKFDSLHKM